MTQQNRHQQVSLLEKRVSSWVAVKKMIVDEKFSSADMLTLLKSIAPKNPLNKFSAGFNTIKMELSQEQRVVPSVAIQIYLPNKRCAEMLSHCMTGRENNMPFKASVQLQPMADGTDGYLLNVKSVGEIVSRGVRGMSNTLDLEQYTKYVLFRSIMTHLAHAGVYQVEPMQPPQNPVFATKLPKGALDNKTLSDQVILAEKVFIPFNKELDGIVRSALTTLDMLELKQNFEFAVHVTPKQLLLAFSARPRAITKEKPSAEVPSLGSRIALKR